jgi:SAM-dependent methyltransferase
MNKYHNIKIGGGDTGEPLNLNRRMEIMNPYLGPGPCSVLDCGCGAGDFLAALNKTKQVDAVGLEFMSSKVEQALEKGIPEHRITQGDIQNMPFESESFDVVLLNEVLEHVPDHHAGLVEVNRVLRPGGTLMVFSPNRRFPFEAHGVVSKRTGKVIGHDVPFIPWIPLPLGQKFFDYPARNYWPGELRLLLKEHGFQLIGKDFVWLTFENISNAQAGWMKSMSGALRRISLLLERTPLIRSMGVSQFLALQKI